MLVRFKVNLGSIDARTVGVDFTKCQQGMECDVPAKAGLWLVENGIATTVVKAVPAAPAIAAPKNETKPAPLAARVKQSEKTSVKDS